MSLTAVEQGDLAAAESVIEAGLETFVEVGEALAKVRDSRLYRDGFDTFEAYCQKRWNLSASYARDLIGGSAQSVAIATVDPDAPAPQNVGQARALSGLEPTQAARTMRQAHDATGGKVTAASIRDARSRPEPTRPPDNTWTRERQAESERFACREILRSILLQATSDVLTPSELAQRGRMLEVVHEYDADRLAAAAEYLSILADYGRRCGDGTQAAS